MNIEEVEKPETTKIYRQKPRASVAATRKLRKFTGETNMRARNHENSDEFRPTPLRHLDLDTPAFYYYRKNPKCYHTVWGKTHFPNSTFWVYMQYMPYLSVAEFGHSLLILNHPCVITGFFPPSNFDYEPRFAKN